MKKTYLIGSVIGLALFATLVAAWAYDTDGGFNIWQQGTCMDNTGNYTDLCTVKTPQRLKEYFPSGINTTLCSWQYVTCEDYDAICQNGACVPYNMSK